jgi:hypothetical protein
MRMQSIRAAANENDLREMKSNHFEKLKGDRKGDYSIRLNLTFRTSPVDYLRISGGAKSDGGLNLYGGARGRAG